MKFISALILSVVGFASATQEQKLVRIPLKMSTDIADNAITVGVKPLNLNYIGGEIEVGSKKKKLPVAFDTSQNRVLISTVDCEACKQSTKTLYDYKKSSTGLSYKNAVETKLNYDEGHSKEKLTGLNIQDTICFAGTTECAQNFEYYAILSAKPTATFDSGVLGLGPGSGSTHFVTNLMQLQNINKKIFSYKLDASSKVSEMIFGGYDKDFIRKPNLAHIGDSEGIVWMEQKFKSSWSLPLSDIRFGSGEGESIGMDAITAELDTGAASTFVPKAVFSQIKSALKSHDWLDCKSSSTICTFKPTVKGSETTCDTSRFPDMYFNFGGEILFQFSKDYMAALIPSGVKDQKICAFTISQTSLNKASIGANFLSQYYSIYDQDQNKIGLAQNNAVSGIEFKFILPVHSIIIPSVALGLIVFLTGFSIFKHFNDRKVDAQKALEKERQAMLKQSSVKQNESLDEED